MGVWVGRGRKARAAYGFDDIALAPGTLTINPNEVDISWDLGGHRFQIPIIAAAMDGVVSPRLAIEMGRLGGLAVLNLEGIFSRYENPDEVLDRITSASLEEATKHTALQPDRQDEPGRRQQGRQTRVERAAAGRAIPH